MISPAVLQAYTGSTDAATLAFLETGTIAWLERWIPRYLGVPKVLTEIHDGPARERDRLSGGRDQGERLRRVWLSEEIEFSVLLSVESRSSASAPWVDLPDPADLTDFEIRPVAPHAASGRKFLRLSAPFPQGRANIRVKFTHGYAEDAGPADVTAVALQMIKSQSVEQEAVGLEESRADGVEEKFGDNLGSLPGVSSRMLAALRRPSY